MAAVDEPRLFELSSFGESSTGRLTLATLEKDIPFEVRRVFWTYGTPPGVIRGHHAHYRTETVLAAVSGTIVVTTELPGDRRREFVLDGPQHALYLPPRCWRTMSYSAGAVQIAFESLDHIEEDYIRSLEDFRRLKFDPERHP